MVDSFDISKGHLANIFPRRDPKPASGKPFEHGQKPLNTL